MRRPSAYRVFLTKNSEYHIRGHVCFGVRDRRTGRWYARHAALNRPLASSFSDDQGHMMAPKVPLIGEALEFVVEGEHVHSSPVLGVELREAYDVTAKLGEALMARSHNSFNSRDTH
jgi:hypothetical protein